MIKVFTSSILKFNEGNKVYTVLPWFNDVSESSNGVDVAYMINEYVYPYRGKYDNLDPSLPKSVGIYDSDNSDKVVMISPKTKMDKKTYSISKVKSYDLDVDSILDFVEKHGDELMDEKTIEAINANSEVSRFEIKEEDDFLKKIIKKLINSKKINLKNYQDKLANRHDLGNMISVLNKSTKMSVVNFERWCEMLGVDWEVTINDNGEDTLAPLEESLRITNKGWNENENK